MTVRGDVAVLGNGSRVFNGTGSADYDPTSWLGVRIGVTGGRAVEDASKDDGFTESFAALRVWPHARVALGLEAARYRGETRSEDRLGASATCYL